MDGDGYGSPSLYLERRHATLNLLFSQRELPYYISFSLLHISMLASGTSSPCCSHCKCPAIPVSSILAIAHRHNFHRTAGFTSPRSYRTAGTSIGRIERSTCHARSLCILPRTVKLTTCILFQSTSSALATCTDNQSIRNPSEFSSQILMRVAAALN